VVSPDSYRISRVLQYSGVLQWVFGFRIRGCHPLWRFFPETFANLRRSFVIKYRKILQPRYKYRFGLFRFRSPLLTESHSISFPRGTEMFQFSRYPPLSYELGKKYPVNGVDFSIRTSTGYSFFAAHRRLS
jgi:hypothetical protein